MPSPGANIEGWKRKQRVIYLPFNEYANGPAQCHPVVTIFYGDYRWHQKSKGMVRVYDSFMVGLN